MANKKELQLGSIQANRFIAEGLEKHEKINAQVQFRHDMLEHPKKLITKANSIDYKVLNDYMHYTLMQNLEWNNYKTKQDNRLKVKHIIYSELTYNLFYNI